MMDKVSPIILSCMAGKLFIKGYVRIAILLVVVTLYWNINPEFLFGSEDVTQGDKENVKPKEQKEEVS